jgi:hypothetical protein
MSCGTYIVKVEALTKIWPGSRVWQSWLRCWRVPEMEHPALGWM